MKNKTIAVKDLKDQFRKFIANPLIGRNFTKDLYAALHTKSGFIAHYNLDGFYFARFLTLHDFDWTLDQMRSNKELNVLIQCLADEAIENARFKIASFEAGVLNQQSLIAQQKIRDLQAQFRFPLI